MLGTTKGKIGARAVATAGSVSTAALLLCSVLAPHAAAASAPRASTIKLGANKENYLCSSGYEWIQTASSAAFYVAPSKGKLTKWMIFGGPDAGSMQFEVWRPLGGTQYSLLYISSPTTLTANKTTKVALDPKVAVQAGDVIGLRSVSQIDCALKTDSSSDTYVYNNSGSVPTVGSTVTFTDGGLTGFEFNIAAIFK